MQEQSKREESLSEELLDRVTGAGCCASTTRNPGPGSFLTCPSCQAMAHAYGIHINRRDHSQELVDVNVNSGRYFDANAHFNTSTENHEAAQMFYQHMEAHGHPDFLAAFAQQRQHYNPDA